MPWQKFFLCIAWIITLFCSSVSSLPQKKYLISISWLLGWAIQTMVKLSIMCGLLRKVTFFLSCKELKRNPSFSIIMSLATFLKESVCWKQELEGSTNNLIFFLFLTSFSWKRSLDSIQSSALLRRDSLVPKI